MKRPTRGLAPLAVAVAGLLLGLVTGSHQLVALLTLPAVVALLAGEERLSLGVPAQVLMLIGCGVFVSLLTAFAPLGQGLASEPLRPPQVLMGAGALLAAGLRLQLERPVGGLAGTLGLGLLVFLAAGSVQSGRVYPGLLIVYAGLAFAALGVLGVRDGDRQAGARRGTRHLAAGVLLLVIAGAMTSSLALAMPRLYASVYDWALRWVGDRPISGFHDGPMRLGALQGMLQSRELVLRVHGDAGDHLRGNVYTYYQRGRWLPARSPDERSIRLTPVPEPGTALGAALAEVRFVAPDVDRFFLPVGSGALQLSPSVVRVDGMGIVRTEGDAFAEALRLLPGDRPAFGRAAPRDEDLELPGEIEADLRRLAAEWLRAGAERRVSAAVAAEAGPGAAEALATDGARIAALRAKLESGYAYSLDFSSDLHRPGSPRDPVLEFLLDGRAGHCEYFASAMTLLARAAGIPARMVTGYRIAERNPVGGYYIVREQHAHAWSEVFVADRGWVTVDPSPLRGESSLAADRTPLFAGLIDYGRVAWQARGAESLLILLVVGLALAQIRRIWTARRSRRERSSGVESGPPAHLQSLLSSLAERGLPRAAGESLEALARRIESQRAGGASWPEAEARLDQAGELLRRYAALRYGELGDAERVRRDIEGWVAYSSKDMSLKNMADWSPK